ncbi:MAG: RluA family pseudouridine synthase [Rectinemataceae bacterium]
MPRGTNYVEFSAGVDDVGRRLDKVLRRFLGGLPLSALYRHIRTGRVLVNRAKSSPDHRIAASDRIQLDPELAPAVDRARSDRGENGLEPLGEFLLLATEDLLFINKPAGELVHGRGSIEDRVRRALRGRSADSLSFSPGPLHRLDRNTSGLVVYSRSALGSRVFSELLRSRTIRKRYLALLQGRLGSEELWKDRLDRDTGAGVSRVVAGNAGRAAVSRVRPLIVSETLSLALIEIQTGLTHQIRVQAASRGFPLLGDVKYGGARTEGGYILHALSLEFPTLPFPDVPECVVAPLPSPALGRLARTFPSSDVPLALADAARM